MEADKDLWEQEYERRFGEGFGTQALRQTAKSAFKAGWIAAIQAVVEKLEARHG
jgi:hypothetical protein